jgi:hypothetical protein
MSDSPSTVTPPTPPQPAGRDASTGRFTPGNAIARTHGLYAQRIAEELAAEREAFLQQSLLDDGGDTEVPARRRALHDYRSRLHVTITQLSTAIDTFGLFDKKGRLRERWLRRLESLIGRAQALDALLGLERRQKHIDPLDAVRAAVVEANSE